MNDMNPAPRRRTQASRMSQSDKSQLLVQQENISRTPPQQAQPWEDTQTQPVIRASVPRNRWIWAAVAAVLTVVMIASSVWGYGQWKAWQQRRAQQRIEAQLAAEKEKYKLSYQELIEKYAWERGIHPAFIAAIVYCESRFDPMALSEVGAMGLMQVRDSTGGWIAEKLGEKEEFKPENLYEPEVNVRYGSWYLGFLKDLFGNDLVKIAAAYHAGQGAVASWLENPEYSSDGQTLKKIPYADTEQYVERVKTAYEMYIKHYYPQQGD